MTFICSYFQSVWPGRKIGPPRCTNTIGSYNCSSCDHQLKQSGNNCTSEDPCLSDPCDRSRFKCITHGFTFTCSCQDGFISHGESCFHNILTDGTIAISVSWEHLIWDKAQIRCHMEGGHLAEFDSHRQWLQVHESIRVTTPTDFWLGGRVNASGSVVWTKKGIEIEKSFKRNFVEFRRCLVAAVGLHPRWYLANCNAFKNFICERRIAVNNSCGSDSDC